MRLPQGNVIAGAGFALALAILIGGNAIAYFTTLRLNKAAELRAQSRMTIQALSNLLGDMEEAESGCRGYVITRERKHLDYYRLAAQQVMPDIEDIHLLTADDPAQEDRINAVRPLIEEKLALMRQLADTAEKSDADPQALIALTDKGSDLMNHIRRLIAAMVIEGTATIRRRDAEARAGTRSNLLAMAVGDLFGCALFVLAFLLLRREISLREQSARAVDQLNQDLKWRAAELAHANRELEAFAASVSHDLRAPLRAIDGFSALLADRYHDTLDDEGKQFLGHVRASTSRMADVIDNLLRLAKITRQEIRREQVDLSRIVSEITAELKAALPQRECDCRIAPHLLTHGDAGLLRVALENLVRNAWKFSARNIKATIEFGSLERGGQRIFFVRDNGVGFDMAHAGKLFQPFARLHGETDFPGVGIGLATVQRIIHRHGGRIWAEGAEGKGATFFFTLS